MEADFDLNSHDILNARNASFSGSVSIRGVDLWDALNGGGGEAGTVTSIRNTWSGDGTTTVFNLSKSVPGSGNVIVFINGVYQFNTTYDINGSVLTFNSAPPPGTNNVQAIIFSSFEVGSTTADAVETAFGEDVETELQRRAITFEDRASFITWLSGKTPPDGFIAFADGVGYKYVTGATDIADATNWLPLNIAHTKNFANDFQAAIDYAVKDAAFPKGGKLIIDGGEYTQNTTLIVPAGLIIEGSGKRGTEITDGTVGAAGYVFETEDFGDLTGTNSWYYTPGSNPSGVGVPGFFGIKDLSIFGNKRPPDISTGDRGGIRIFGKSFELENIIIFNVDGTGLYTECGETVGQELEWDMPEGNNENIQIKRPGGHGWHFRGPHDSNWRNINIAEAGYAEVASPTGNLYGLLIEGQIGVTSYYGYGEINDIHIYNTKGTGFRSDSAIHIGQIISESNSHMDFHFGPTARNTHIGWAQAYKSRGDSGTLPSMRMDSGSFAITVDEFQLTISEGMQHGIQCEGDRCKVDFNMRHTGSKATNGYGLYDAGTRNMFSGTIEGWSGSSQYGLHVDGATYGKYDVIIEDCAYAIKLENSPTKFEINAMVDLGGGQDVFDTATKTYLIGMADADRQKCSIKIRGTHTSKVRLQSPAIDVTTTGKKTITIPHGLCMQPLLEEVQATLHYGGTNTSWDALVTVFSVDATNIVIDVTVKTALPGAASAYLSVDAHIPCGV
jgi:hypothetical protein